MGRGPDNGREIASARRRPIMLRRDEGERGFVLRQKEQEGGDPELQRRVSGSKGEGAVAGYISRLV